MAVQEDLIVRFGDATPKELADFRALVLKSGEVTEVGLAGRIKRAHALAMLMDLGQPVGGAALKNPDELYKNKVSSRAQYPVDAFDHELGWVFLEESHRGRGLSLKLVEAVLASVPSPVFATSKRHNDAMHRVLKRFRFKQVGRAYESEQEPGVNLLLFMRAGRAGD